MAAPKKGKRLKRKIRITQSVGLVHKNDATRVERPDTLGMRRVKARPPADVSPTIRIRIRKK